MNHWQRETFCCKADCTSIGQQVLLYFVSTVLQHVSHVLRNLLHHTVNSRETSKHTMKQHKLPAHSQCKLYTHTTSCPKRYVNIHTSKTLHDLAKVLSWHGNFKCGDPRSTSKQECAHRGGEHNAKKDHKGAFNL